MIYSRFKVLLRLILPWLAMLLSQPATAGPMGFDESFMAMGDFNNNWRESFVNYAITPRDAFGVSATYMRADDKAKSRTLEEVTYTRLLKRWNAPHAQANLWFQGGIGALQGEDERVGKDDEFEQSYVYTPGVQFDYETTRIYFQAAHRLYRASGINHDYTSVRVGFLVL